MFNIFTGNQKYYNDNFIEFLKLIDIFNVVYVVGDFSKEYEHWVPKFVSFDLKSHKILSKFLFVLLQKN